MSTAHSFTFVLDDAQQILLTDLLRTGNYRPAHVAHTLAAVDAENCRVALYKSGKCLVQGKGAADFVTFVMEPRVLGAARLGYEESLDVDHYQPHMGVDESGKGDFFGPMVVAAAYADRDLVRRMRAMGVRDSKSFSSDKRLRELARDLRDLLGKRFSIVRIGPAAYNRLYLKMRSVNGILAWGHARALENLLAVVPDCPRAVSDQFGSRGQVLRALMAGGRRMELEQRHRAESDPAVAAASILARSAFLQALDDLSESREVRLPKGASALTVDAGVDLLKRHGPEVLLDTAKCHFRTTDRILAAMDLTRAALGPVGAAVSQSERAPAGRPPPAGRRS